MSERAELFARSAAAHEYQDVLHIYHDGLVVAVGADEARTETLRDLISKNFPAAEFGRAGFVSVFVVPMDVEETRVEHLPPALCLMTTAYHDHREQDANTIDAGFALVSAAIRGS